MSGSLNSPQHKSVPCAALGKLFTLYPASPFITYDKNKNYAILIRIKGDNANETIKWLLSQRRPILIEVNAFKQGYKGMKMSFLYLIKTFSLKCIQKF